MKFLLLVLLISTSSFAFTLSESQGRGFPKNNINIRIANTDCSGAGFSVQKLRSMVSNAINDYWNKVTTSDLYLDNKGISTAIDIDGLTHEQVLNTIVADNEIVAGCNDDADDFSNPSILGSAVLSCITTSRCRAVLILNSNNSALNNFSTSEVEAVIAHELGHAIGLGHTEYKHNLMYYSTGDKSQKWLGQDDVDGVTYLYPHESEGCGLFGNMGATIALNGDDDDTNFPFFGILILGFLGTIFFMQFLSKINFQKLSVNN